MSRYDDGSWRCSCGKVMLYKNRYRHWEKACPNESTYQPKVNKRGEAK